MDFFTLEQSGRKIKLTTHLQLAPRLSFECSFNLCSSIRLYYGHTDISSLPTLDIFRKFSDQFHRYTGLSPESELK